MVSIYMPAESASSLTEYLNTLGELEALLFTHMKEMMGIVARGLFILSVFTPFLL